MHDAGGGRHDAEVVEGALPPFEELITFAVTLKLTLGVEEERGCRAESIHLHGVVDDQVDRHDRVDLVGVSAHAGHGAAQRGQVNYAGHAGKVLQDDTRRLEWDFNFASGIRPPVGDGFNRLSGDLEAFGLTQSRLQQHLDRERQPVHIGGGNFFQSIQPVDCHRAAARVEGISCVEIILSSHFAPSWIGLALSFCAGPAGAIWSRRPSQRPDG